jgi:hypothetical protein
MRITAWGWCALLGAHMALGQAPAPLQDPGQHSVRIVRTTAAPPVIDGKLDEEAWKAAALVDNLHQTSPIEYAVPEERTEVYLMYDDEALYIGARLYDPEPDKITANNLRQADNVGQDDRFYVTLDPFNSRTRGYFFGLNPNGVRADGLYQNVTEFYGAWDSIFYGAAGRFEGGWIAEFAIPFKSISFDPNTDTWGVNFSRGVVRKNENIAWVSRNRAYNPAVSGLMTGVEALDPHGLDVVTSASLRDTRVAAGGGDSDFEPSLDLVYKITPELNGSLTFNTDFSATEVDDRQVNLTRFGLFFPEKRDFFLREADIFEFGRIGAQQDNISVGQPSRENGRPFFSRRVGLSGTGQIVDIDYGAKVSGRIGEWDIGALSIRQDEFEYDTRDPATGAVTRVRLGPETLSAARARTRVLGESTFGFIATSGDPRGDVDNSLVHVHDPHQVEEEQQDRSSTEGAHRRRPAPATSLSGEVEARSERGDQTGCCRGRTTHEGSSPRDRDGREELKGGSDDTQQHQERNDRHRELQNGLEQPPFVGKDTDRSHRNDR